MMSRQKKTDFKCDQCSYSTNESHRLKRHKNVHSSLKPWICRFPGCDFRSNHESALKNHQRRHEKKAELRKPYPCTFKGCSYRAALKCTLTDHVKAAHTPGRPRNFQCPLCPASFHDSGELKAHIPRHTNEKRFKCKLCKYKTVHGGYLPVHVQRMHGKVMKYTCEFPGCNYSAKQRASYIVHRQTHISDPLLRRPFPCSFPECSYRAKTNAVLKKHYLWSHNPDRSRDVPCPLCPEAFFSHGELKSHISFRHTREKRFHCDKCDYATVAPANLRRHHRSMHEEKEPLEKRFKCDLCDYCANRKYHFDHHVKTAHSARRDFRCNHTGCNYDTNDSYVFKRHLQIHEKDLDKGFPFQCAFPGCGFRRRSRPEIKAHERRHKTSSMQYECKFCSKTYPDKISSEFHNVQVHGIKSHYPDAPLQLLAMTKIPVVTLDRICLQIM